MFDPRSRYANIDTATLSVTDRDGNTSEIRYVKRRFLPVASELQIMAEHSVVQGERLDYITAKFLGDPTQFWRIVDAENVLDPDELDEEPGRVLHIPVPHF